MALGATLPVVRAVFRTLNGNDGKKL